MPTQDEKETIAESGMWTLQCRCGNINTISGKRILFLPGFICPNCEENPNRIHLQNAVRHLNNFLLEIGRATTKTDKHDTWEKITPPPASWKIFEI